MIIKPPSKMIYSNHTKFSIFLAGSIDMGSAVDWQKEVSDSLSGFDVDLFNPRRDDWNSSWKQSMENPFFVEQVTWEQHALEVADYRIFVMTKDSKSPITLLELGRYASLPGVICCEKGFYREANVEISAKLWGIPFYTSIDEMLLHTKMILTEKGLLRNVSYY